MSSTNFVDNVTIVYSSWLNDINNFFYNTCANATTAAQMRTAIGAMSRTGDTVTGSYNITGTVTATTLSSTANATVGGTLGVTGTTTLGSISATTANITTVNTAQLNATDASFTNSPTVPTLTSTDNTTKVASTAFVQSVALGSGGLPLSQVSNVWLTQDTAFTLTTTNGNTFFNTTRKDSLGEITRPGGIPTFTATRAGTYLVSLLYSTVTATTTAMGGSFLISTSGIVVQNQGFPCYTDNSNTSSIAEGSMTVILTAGQTITFNAYLISGTAALATNTTTSGVYINKSYATIVRLN